MNFIVNYIFNLFFLVDKKPVNVNVLKAIRNEMIHRERLSTNLMDDCRATKDITY